MKALPGKSLCVWFSNVQVMAAVMLPLGAVRLSLWRKVKLTRYKIRKFDLEKLLRMKLSNIEKVIKIQKQRKVIFRLKKRGYFILVGDPRRVSQTLFYSTVRVTVSLAPGCDVTGGDLVELGGGRAAIFCGSIITASL